MRIMRSAISPRLATRILRNGVRFISPAHGRATEIAWAGAAGLRIAADRHQLGKHGAGSRGSITPSSSTARWW